MNYRNALAPAHPVGWTPAAIAKKLGQTAILTVALALGLQAATGAPAFAQAKPAAKKPAAPAAPVAPAAQPQAPAQGEQQQQPVQLIYSPWTKFCLKNQNDPNSSKSASPAKTPASNPACRWSPRC